MEFHSTYRQSALALAEFVRRHAEYNLPDRCTWDLRSCARVQSTPSQSLDAQRRWLSDQHEDHNQELENCPQIEYLRRAASDLRSLDNTQLHPGASGRCNTARDRSSAYRTSYAVAFCRRCSRYSDTRSVPGPQQHRGSSRLSSFSIPARQLLAVENQPPRSTYIYPSLNRRVPSAVLTTFPGAGD